MTKHTPGPWAFNSETGEVFQPDTQDSVAMVLLRRDQENARLIAAAPELLEALSDLLVIISESDGVAGYHLSDAIATWDEFGEYIDAARAAIRKAEGSDE